MAPQAYNYYQFLQVDPEASSEVIEAAYRRLARLYHPDYNASSEAMATMQELNSVYAVLKDPVQRRVYDQKLIVQQKVSLERRWLGLAITPYSRTIVLSTAVVALCFFAIFSNPAATRTATYQDAAPAQTLEAARIQQAVIETVAALPGRQAPIQPTNPESEHLRKVSSFAISASAPVSGPTLVVPSTPVPQLTTMITPTYLASTVTSLSAPSITKAVVAPSDVDQHESELVLAGNQDQKTVGQLISRLPISKVIPVVTATPNFSKDLIEGKGIAQSIEGVQKNAEGDIATPIPTFTATPTPISTPTSAPTQQSDLAFNGAASSPVRVESNGSQPSLEQSTTVDNDNVSGTSISEDAVVDVRDVDASVVQLISPAENMEAGGPVTFEWKTNFEAEADHGFELIFWRPGEDAMARGFGLSRPTIGPSIRVNLDDLDKSLGDFFNSGEYRWGILYVQTSPDYQRVKLLSEGRKFRFSNFGTNGKSSSNKSNPTSGE